MGYKLGLGVRVDFCKKKYVIPINNNEDYTVSVGAGICFTRFLSDTEKNKATLFPHIRFSKGAIQ